MLLTNDDTGATPSSNPRLLKREIFAAFIVFIIGFIYLGLDGISLYSRLLGNEKISLAGYKVKQFAWWLDVKMIAAGLLCITGGWLFIQQKKAGWIISAAVILNVIFLGVLVFVFAATTNYRDTAIALLTGFLVLLIISFFGMFKRATRKKFKVNNKSFLLAFLLYAGIIALFAL
jgi:hypothetical protein